MKMVHDFNAKLEWSNGTNIKSDIDRIKHALGEKCIRVEKTDIETDKTGVDYFAYLSKGAIINVDAKRREANSSKYWKNGEPELAIETRSVINPFKIGWTFNTASPVDYILYSFEPCDSNYYYFIPFQLLRKVAFENGRNWLDAYKEKTQNSGNWKSTCIFVPASVVLNTIYNTMMHVDYSPGKG